jgi:hypothetical protein
MSRLHVERHRTHGIGWLRAGVQVEIGNVALYDRLLRATRRCDLLDVFHALRPASQHRHPPAFQRCALRG